ncbi:MAG: haloacid dehalogenase-like hydrolase [Desulfurococcaceae archaeon]
MPKLGLIVLDLDETTLENIFDFYEAYCTALRIHNEDCPGFDEFMVMFNENKLHEKIPSHVNHVDFWRTFRKLYASKHSWLKKGLREFLYYVKNLGVRIVIISGRESPSYGIWFDLRKHGIDEYVDELYTMWDLEILRGYEEFLFDKSYLVNHARRRLGVQGETVCIGDYVTDYYSCVKAGGIFIGINSEESRNTALKKAGVKYVARDFTDVLVILSELGLLS